ncbi:MAG: hypothetical protein AUK33_02055 [Flavobacteriaceae bacterium CG2_30_34_30]|nr:MAG: hypothetical protein AUK33_02055 [Flavobacteriaceae bacterium CG2_30_34_30]
MTFSQRNFKEFNIIGISGGITLYDIITNDLQTKRGESLMFGLQMRGNVYNNFDMLYGIAFYDTKIGIAGSSLGPLGTSKFINYTMQSAQISVLWGYKIIKNHLSIEGGPILNVNGKLTLKDTQFKNDILDGYTTLRAVDIEDVSKANFHAAIGMTAGFRNFRIFTQYQYGVTNILNKLNSQNLENTGFKGNSSLLVFGATVYL